MKWYEHLLLYLLSCVITELILVMFFSLAAIENGDNSVWNNFYIVQIGLPIVSCFVWLIIEMALDYDEKQTKEAEWYKEVNEMLKEYKEKNDKH